MLALALGSAAAPASRPLTEDQAFDLVFKAIHQLYPDEPPSCFALMTEEKSRTTFDIAVREDHKKQCGGDPGVMPVRVRLRVGRRPVRLWVYDLLNDAYRPCRLSRSLKPTCPSPD
jgi:hypothetical protein